MNPLFRCSVFGSGLQVRQLSAMAIVLLTAPLGLIGTLGGTILTLVFLPALYALWFRIDPNKDARASVSEAQEPHPVMV